MEEDNFLAGLGMVLIWIVLSIIFIPILLGIGIALITGATGLVYYGIIITVSTITWLLIGLTFWL